MTPYKLEVLRLLEIGECTISCPDCQTKMTVRLDKMAPIPGEGPSCRKKFDSDLSTVLFNLREAYGCGRNTSFGVEFHIREQIKEEKEPH